MVTKVDEKQPSLKNGLHLYRTLAALDKTIRDIKRLCAVLSILTPLAFIAYYIFFIIKEPHSGAGFYVKLVMFALVVAELVINIVFVARADKKKKTGKKLLKRILRYAKMLVSFVASGYAIYEALTYEGNIVKYLGTAIMVISLIAKLLGEIAARVASVYLTLIKESFRADIDEIKESNLGKAVGAVSSAVSKPKLTMINAADKLVQKVSSIINDKEKAECEEKAGESAEDSEIDEMTREYRARREADEKAREERERREREAEVEKAKADLKSHFKGLFKKK